MSKGNNYDTYRGWLANKTYPDSTATAYTRTAAGRLASRVWARGTNTAYAYNAAGALATNSYNDGTAGVTNGYDRRGRLTLTTNGPTVTTRTLNDAGETMIESYVGGVLGSFQTTNGFDGLARRTNFAVLSNTLVLARTTNSYDAASRLLTVSDGTDSATYSYLANSALIDHITFAHNGTTVMTTSNQFDNLNRLTATLAGPAGATTVHFQYAYNPANQRTAVTNLDGSYWTNQYDTLGQVTNGVKHWSDASVVAGQQFGYGFDTIGNRTMSLAGGDQSGANLRSASYTANTLNQYTSRTVPSAVDVIGSATNTASVWVNQNATYRKNNYFWEQLPVTNTSGSVWQTVTTLAALPNGSSAEYGVTNIGHVFLPQTPESYTYDADGNTTQDGHFTYGWNGENRLTNLTSLSSTPLASQYKLDFTYDYMGRRIQKIVSTNSGSSWGGLYTNRFVYDGWNVVAILDGGDKLLYSFVWGLDLSGSMQGAGGVGGLVSMTIYSGANAGTYFPCYDGNGNVMAMVNEATAVVAGQWAYGPFGELIQATGPLAFLNPFLFSTKYYDQESGLYYYGHRYYNPSTGRWPSRDPIEERGGLNLYGFVGNDGIDHVDPFGLEQWKDVLAEIKRRDKMASTHPCCNAQGVSLPLGSLIPTLTATASGMTVTGTATYKVVGRGPVRVLDYVWWNCFDADREGSYTWGFHRHLYSDWQDYGWTFGGTTKSEAVQGATLPPAQDHFDSGHWDWKVCIIYLYCDKGFFHVDYQTSSPQVEFDWSQPTLSWTNPHSPTGP